MSALGHMLCRVDMFKPGPVLRREIYTFLVPLLLSFQDNNPEVVKACGGALTEWTKVIGWSPLTQTFRHTTLSDHIQVLKETCNYLASTCEKHLLGEFLSQSFGFLKSPQSFLRAAAVYFIGLIVKKINMNYIHEDDVQQIQNALQSVRDDPVESIQTLVSTTLKNIDTLVNAGPVRNSVISQLSTTFFKFSGLKTPRRKKRLFKIVRRERGDDSQKKKVWNCLRSTLHSLNCQHTERVKDTPLEIGSFHKKSIQSQAQKSESPSEETETVQKPVASRVTIN